MKGGGRDDRIKSLLPSILELISGFDDVFFVSLQYGDITQGQLADLQSAGVTVAADKRINALKNMDNWLAQVDACDGVISGKYNVHAGGLGKPTMCLLSQDSDWRWLKSIR